MLSPQAVAVTAEPDGRGAPNISRHGRKRLCRAGVTGSRGRFRQETGLLMLFRDGPQGYPLSRARQSPLDLGNAGLGFQRPENDWEHCMQFYQLLTRAVFCAVSFALLVVAGGLIVYAGMQLVSAFSVPEQDIGKSLLDSVGYTVIAIAVFGVAKYILEEEVIDPTQMRNAGQARRSITKFVSTISIAVFLEALVVVFQTSKGTDLSMMLYPTILMFSGVTMVVGLGVYQRLSTSAEREVRSSPAAAAEEQAELDKF
jgi:hypothetical protein